MPTPATSPRLGLPRFDANNSTAIWEHLNAIVDGIDALWGPWTAYTPTWSQSNGTILALGAGTLLGRYQRMGKTVVGQIRLERAADSNVGTQSWIFSLPPVQPRAWNMVGGGFSMSRDGALFGGSVFPVSSTAIGAIAGDLGRISNTIPTATHAAGDWYSLQFVYEAA